MGRCIIKIRKYVQLPDDYLYEEIKFVKPEKASQKKTLISYINKNTNNVETIS